MKELKDMLYYDGNYDISIRSYLTHAEIESIANAVVAFKTWAVRQENIDALVLHFCTDITDEQIEKIGMPMFIKSGLMDTVKEHVFNYAEIDKAIVFKEKADNAMVMARQLQDMQKAMGKDAKKQGKK